MVTLESQKEVDEFFAVLNHGILSKALPVIGSQWQSLVDYKSEDYREIHEKISRIIN
jgi:hypothetical protein